MRTWRVCVRSDFDFDPGGDSLFRVQIDDAKATGPHSCHFRHCCIPFDGDRHGVLDCEISGKHVEQVNLFILKWLCIVFLETSNKQQTTNNTLLTFAAIDALLVALRVVAFSEDRVRAWIAASSLPPAPDSTSLLC